jgi:hypothetical protein
MSGLKVGGENPHIWLPLRGVPHVRTRKKDKGTRWDSIVEG